MNRHRHRHGRGFTLIELLVVVALIGILLGIAAPSFASFISNYRATAAINDVLQGIALARSEALKRGRRVTLAPVSGDWRNGWIVFVDSTGASRNQAYDSGEEIIFQHDKLPSSIAVSAPGSATVPFGDAINARSFVAFAGNGYARASDGSAAPLNAYGIVMRDTLASPSDYRTLCMQASGRPRIIRAATADSCAAG